MRVQGDAPTQAELAWPIATSEVAALFDAEHYLGSRPDLERVAGEPPHPDVADAGVNPWVHYLQWGRAPPA